MAFQSGNTQGRRSDINITPLVDVVLVVLIIFMVMTPAMLEKLDLELAPKIEVNQNSPQASQVVVSIAADGTLSLDRQEILRSALSEGIRQKLAESREKVVFFEVDDQAVYGDVVSVLDICRGSGADVLGFVMQ